MLWFPVLAATLGCRHDDPATPTGDVAGPLGIPIAADGRIYAGAAVIDVTPEITETFTDLDGDYTFDGCVDDPTGCAEPFDDVDGDGVFDAVWIGGYGPLRAARGVHDPITVRALVLAMDGEYVALVAEDLVGLGHPRIWEARDALAADGFDPDRLLAAATHNHQGPDTMGLWGSPLAGVPGFDPDYQERIAGAIEQAVRDAAADMVPVTLTVGSVAMRDRSPWFSGSVFGGKNPKPVMHGMIDDHRDPIVVSDQLLALQGADDGGQTVFTLTNWSGHPEVRGSDNDQLSADWVGVARSVLEERFGGVAIHFPESLGGMQSALGGELPLVLDDGTHVYATCDAAAVADPEDADCFGQPAGADRIDADGDRVPVWAERDSWAFVTSHGWHIAEAAIDALAAGETLTSAPIRVMRQPMVLPITNVGYNLLGASLFDIGADQALTDAERCPEAVDPDVLGCFEVHVFRLDVGPIGWLSVPGELLPELAWGLPEDDPRWVTEAADPLARGAGSAYFPQHDPDCAAITSYEDCRHELALGDCDCKSLHAWPYRLSEQPHRPLLEAVDQPYHAMLGMADSYFSYVIPEPDFNDAVSLLTDDGDHYEDTVSAARVFADRVFEAHEALAARWAAR
ncbi:MAG: hypothetical protein R3F59_36380 [Myxococcota bacterium]